MLSNTLDRIAFYSLFLVIVLLPLFTIPGSPVTPNTSKGLLFVIGLSVCIIFFIAARIKEGRIEIPKSWILFSSFLILLASLVGALASSSSPMSFFGVMFDVGSFWFMVGVFLLMLMSSLIIREEKSARLVLLGLLFSLAAVFLFQIFRFISPATFSLGILGGKADNLVGSWYGFGLVAGFTALFIVFLVEFFQVSRSLKWLLGILACISVFLVAVVNFVLIWKLVGIFALVFFVYKISISPSEEEGKGGIKNFPFLSFTLVLVSLLFLVSRGFIGGFIPNSLAIEQIEARPSLSGTLTVGKGVLSDNLLLGAGPNKWSDAWALHKPLEINQTQFWDFTFGTGSGLIPTLALSGGVIAIFSWVVFMFFVFSADFKILFSNIRKKTNFESLAFFMGALYFLVASFFYPAGLVIFSFLFGFLGIFIGLSKKGENDFIRFSFSGNPRKSFFVTLSLVVLMLTSAGLGFKYLERFASTLYFNKTFSSENTLSAEANISRALTLYPNDLYFRTYVQVYFTKLNNYLNQGTPLTEEQRAELQNGFSNSLAVSNLAINWNKDNYLNYQTLGLLYATAGNSGSLEAHNQAVESYTKASELNPLNPRLKLEIARSHFALGNMNEARDFVNQALALKGDYQPALTALGELNDPSLDSSSRDTQEEIFEETILDPLPDPSEEENLAPKEEN